MNPSSAGLKTLDRRREQTCVRSALALLLLLGTLGVACRSAVRPEVVFRADLSVARAASLLPERVKAKERAAWARAVLEALVVHGKPRNPETVCQVYAIIEQESGFQADPVVPQLGQLVMAELAERSKKLGPLGDLARRELLSGKAPRHRDSFETRLQRARTEQDVDRTFRDVLAYSEGRFPTSYRALDLLGGLFGQGVEAFNPVTTAGSMQVSVPFAMKHAAEHEREISESDLRDELYTREGGVFYGTARLFQHDAAYAQPVFRFADYNAGVYASRNAALQEQLGKLIDRPLALDGDLLAYDKRGDVLDVETKSLTALLTFRAAAAPQLSERSVRRDVLREKSAGLELTDTYRALKRAYAQRYKADAAYARLPDVAIRSVKMKQDRSTAWFARNVDVRFRACLARAE